MIPMQRTHHFITSLTPEWDPHPAADYEALDSIERDYAVRAEPALSNSISSRLSADLGPLDPDPGQYNHAPVLDIDFPAQLVPSATEGHFHLYLDHELTWEQYAKLLVVMGEIGLLEQGFVDASLARGATFVRAPWNPKRKAAE